MSQQLYAPAGFPPLCPSIHDMAPRPAPLNLDDGDPQRPPRFPNFHMDLPSPRSGEVPPALSPLDAFALHSRMLAKKFDEEAQAGRRLSRIPHNTVASELANRPNYFRSASGESEFGVSDLPEVQEDSPPSTRNGLTVTGADEESRRLSHYPMLSRISRVGGYDGPGQTPFFDAQEEQSAVASGQDYFCFPRAASPEPEDPKVNVEAPSPNVPSLTNSVDSYSSSHPQRTMTDGSNKSQNSDRGLLPTRSAAAPKSPRSAPSIRAVTPGSVDDETPLASSPQMLPSRKFSGSSGFSRPRSPFSPPTMHPSYRSPSMTSEYSITGHSVSARRAPNFSRPDRPMSTIRPMSPGGRSIDTARSFDSRPSYDSRPSGDIRHHYQTSVASSATQHSTHSTPSDRHSGEGSRDDTPDPIPQLLAGDGEEAEGGADALQPDASPAPTYTYSKFTLPRGRSVRRNSLTSRVSWIEKQFSLEAAGANGPQILHEEPSVEPAMKPADPPPFDPKRALQELKVEPTRRHDDVPAISSIRTLRTPTYEHARMHSDSSALQPSRTLHTPSTQHARKLSDGPVIQALPRPPSPTTIRLTSAEARSGRDRAFSSSRRSKSAGPGGSARSLMQTPSHSASQSIDTDSTDRTIRNAAPQPQPRASPAELSPEEHLEIGIQAHSAGHTNKSTYHLRLAARAGLPTGMLLYALACRHGWGMRPNQEEGVMWLRKAIDGSQLELADVETTLAAGTSSSQAGGGAAAHKGDPVAEAMERRKRKAQFALAIYELGISYMNGWGCPRDRPLALRCYEIAGAWGDCDASAEAGYCYTQGVGCKKDMRKAAALYRKAAAGGMSMAGNSW